MDLDNHGYQLTLVLIAASVSFTAYHALTAAFRTAILWLFISSFLIVVAFTYERYQNPLPTND